MITTVRQRADTVATFRYINVRLMEILAAWVPTTAELEVKILFGRHLWDFAQHTDAFGNRCGELRLGRHTSRQAAAPFVAILDQLAALEGTGKRIDGFYSGMLPILKGLYRRDLDEIDQLLEEPTIRIIKRAMWDFERLQADSRDILNEFPAFVGGDSASSEMKSMAESLEGFVEFRPVVERDVEE
jgi:hypothetical protein